MTAATATPPAPSVQDDVPNAAPEQVPVPQQPPLQQRAPPPTAPTPPQSRAINEIQRLLSRSPPQLTSAQNLIARALGTNPACIEPLRLAFRNPKLSAVQKLPLFLAAGPLATTAITSVYGQIAGHFWRIPDTRGYVRLLLDTVFTASDAADWETALSYARQVLEANHGDNNGIRDRVPLFLLHLNRPLEALNFCLCWLDTAHDDYDSARYCPEGGFADLERHKQADFDPEKPLQTQKVQNLGHASLIFSAALAAYRVFGKCTLSTSWMREAHNANSHVVPTLLTPREEWPKKTNQNPRGLGSEPEAKDYVFFAADLWDDGTVEWVKDVKEEVMRRECARRDCRKVESRRGEWKVCGGCLASWYCGPDCQTVDWKTGGHRRRCKEERNIRELTEKMGSGMQWGK